MRKPTVTAYFKFERGERHQIPGELAAFHPYSGLTYTNRITFDQLKRLDKIIEDALKVFEEENEIPGTFADGTRFEASSLADSSGSKSQIIQK